MPLSFLSGVQQWLGCFISLPLCKSLSHLLPLRCQSRETRVGHGAASQIALRMSLFLPTWPSFVLCPDTYDHSLLFRLRHALGFHCSSAFCPSSNPLQLSTWPCPTPGAPTPPPIPLYSLPGLQNSHPFPSPPGHHSLSAFRPHRSARGSFIDLSVMPECLWRLRSTGGKHPAEPQNLNSPLVGGHQLFRAVRPQGMINLVILGRKMRDDHGEGLGGEYGCNWASPQEPGTLCAVRGWQWWKDQPLITGRVTLRNLTIKKDHQGSY